MTIKITALFLLLLTINLKTSAQEIEPNNSIATANQFALNSSLTGDLFISPSNDFNDYFEVSLAEDGNLTASMEVESGLVARLRIYNQAGSQLAISASATGPDVVSISANCLPIGSYFIWVEGIGGSGVYTVSNSAASPLLAADIEPNNSLVNAQVFMVPDGSVTGHLGYGPDFHDYYGLLPGDDGNITITANFDETLTGRLRLAYKNGSQISISTTGIGEISTTGTCLANDTIYAWVERISGCGSYDMLFEVDTPPAHDQDVEPNNSIATANVFVEPNQTVQGRMGYVGVNISDFNDYYGLLPGDDGNITITANFDETLTGRLRLAYKNGSQISISTAGVGEISTTGTCLANDTIYAWVERISGCGSYDMLFEVDTPPTHDQDVEPNNSIATANVFLEPNDEVEGRMGYVGVNISDFNDYYGLLPGDDGSVTISASFDETMTGRLRVYYKNGTQASISTTGTGEIATTATCLANDTIYAWVERISGCGSYLMQFETTPPVYESDVESNNSIATSSPMVSGEKITGHLGYAGVGFSDPNDYYSFEVVQAPFELDAKLIIADGLTARLRLYTNSGSQMAITVSGSDELNLVHTITAPGTYHVWVESLSGCGSYVLGDLCSLYPVVEATPPGPLNKCPEELVQLSATSGLSSYVWFNGADQVGANQQYAASSSGDYSVVGYDINGCPDTSNVVLISPIDCDDGDPCTDDFCDTELGCSNIFSGDDDEDGTCNNLDLCPNDPDKIEPGNCGCNEPEPGASCDDGDPNTVGDIIQSDCSCIGDLEFDCPDISANFGDSCDDGDEGTINDQIQEDCSCSGVDSVDCPSLGLNIGDSCDDGDGDTEDDIVGDDCVCTGTLIDADSDGITDSQDNCPFIENAEQEDLDEDGLGDVCDDDIDGDGDLNDVDCDPFDSSVFIGADCDDEDEITVDDQIQEDCSCLGVTSVDCPLLGLNFSDNCDDEDETTINDLVNLACECVGESIYDCPELQANVGDDCDDGNDDLIPGTVNEFCECEPGESDYDCPELEANFGDACNDGDTTTINDAINIDCICEGTPGGVVSNDEPENAILNTPDRLWGVPGWDTFQVGCATLSMKPCSGNPEGDSWYKFVAQSENQGILARANPSDPNAANVDMVIEVFDVNMMPLAGMTEGSCAVSRSCFNNAGSGVIERAVPTGLSIGETYIYRVYDANGGVGSGCNLLVDTKVKTYAMHAIIDGCEDMVVGEDVVFTIEDPVNLYNIPPVPVFNVRMVMLDGAGDVVAMAPLQNPAIAGGLIFDLSSFSPAVDDGFYTVHAQNEVKMHANGCVSAFWSQLGPGCPLQIGLGLENQGLLGIDVIGEVINLSIFPNPNQGDQVYIEINNLKEEEQSVIIELTDVFGKKVLFEKVASQDGTLNYNMNLGRKLASGLYFVQVSVNDEIIVGRLMIE